MEQLIRQLCCDCVSYQVKTNRLQNFQVAEAIESMFAECMAQYLDQKQKDVEDEIIKYKKTSAMDVDEKTDTNKF